MTRLVAARVRAPGSTSNLGSGYDTIGLALDRYLDAAFEPDESGSLTVARSGTLARLTTDPGPDLVAEAFEASLQAAGVAPSGLLRLDSTIPVARGLGASAAAIVAGWELGRAVRGLAPEPETTFREALAREGHPDNAAPATFGGLSAVTRTEGGPRVLSLEISPAVGFAYAAPSTGVSTREARALLPRTVPHQTAVDQLGRVLALVTGLAEGDPELLKSGLVDGLHVAHRLALIPDADRAIMAGRDAGAWDVTVSGAGSGLIAVCPPDRADEVADAMHRVFDAGRGDPECVGFAVRPSMQGVTRLAPEPE